MHNSSDAPLHDLGALGNALRQMRKRLTEGGPDVNEAALHAYIAGVLEEDERQIVARNVETYRLWHDAYWKIRAAVDSEKLDLEWPVPPWLQNMQTWGNYTFKPNPDRDEMMQADDLAVRSFQSGLGFSFGQPMEHCLWYCIAVRQGNASEGSRVVGAVSIIDAEGFTSPNTEPEHFLRVHLYGIEADVEDSILIGLLAWPLHYAEQNAFDELQFVCPAKYQALLHENQFRTVRETTQYPGNYPWVVMKVNVQQFKRVLELLQEAPKRGGPGAK